MRLLFAHDHRFCRSADAEVWTTGQFTASIWHRYLQDFDRLSVVGRDGGHLDNLPNLARSDADSVRFHLLPNLSSVRGLLHRPSARRQMAALVREADAVVARLPSEIGLMACRLSEQLGKPLLIEVVGSASVWQHHTRRIGALYASITHKRMQRAVRNAPLVNYVTERWLQKEYPSPNRHLSLATAAGGASRMQAGGVTNAAVILPTPAVRIERAARIRELLHGRPPVFGTIATLRNNYKGLQVAIRALADLRSEGMNFSYRVLGAGDPGPWHLMAVQHGLENVCHFDGTKEPGDDVLGWIDGVDVYVQPSLREGLPRSVLEAMSRGAACLGSTAGGIPELVASEYIHRAGDQKELANHFRQLISNPPLVARLSEHSFAKVEQFSSETVEKKRSSMLRALRDRAEQVLDVPHASRRQIACTL